MTELTPEILAELQKHDEQLPHVTCLACGYIGPMGIVEKIVPWYASWKTLGILLLIGIGTFPAAQLDLPATIFALMYLLGVVGPPVMLATIIVTRASGAVKRLVSCPKCRNRLGPV